MHYTVAEKQRPKLGGKKLKSLLPGVGIGEEGKTSFLGEKKKVRQLAREMKIKNKQFFFLRD